MLANDVRLCDGAMRLIGRPLLLLLADDADEDLQGGLRALAAEIESADWKSSRDLHRAFPKARIEKRRVFVELDERHCAVIIVNYERSVAMVEYAGANADYGKAPPSALRKAGRRK
jgi:mRNA-degrading endonuclease HigB of HigAB toxin-antitoxin module